jgi:hypothetical protein
MKYVIRQGTILCKQNSKYNSEKKWRLFSLE